jgi:hypothetical protein
MYNVLILLDLSVYDNKKIWKMRILLKNLNFAWYLRQRVILAKNSLIKENWHESKICVFYPQDETIKYLFF